MAFWRKKPAGIPVTITSGSSTRSTAPPTSFTATPVCGIDRPAAQGPARTGGGVRPVQERTVYRLAGQRRQLNDRRIRVSRTLDLDRALLGTGFPLRSHQHLETWIDTLRDLLYGSSDIRRAGSAALDLAHVACGRLDGFWEFGLSPWDTGRRLLAGAGGRRHRQRFRRRQRFSCQRQSSWPPIRVFTRLC